MNKNVEQGKGVERNLSTSVSLDSDCLKESRPLFDSRLSVPESFDPLKTNFCNNNRKLEIGTAVEETDRLRNILMQASEPQKPRNTAHRDLYHSAGSGAYSSLTDLNSLHSAALTTFKSSDTNMLRSAASGIHPVPSSSDCSQILSIAGNFLSGRHDSTSELMNVLKLAKDHAQGTFLKEDAMAQKLGSLWRHHSAPSSIQRQVPWPFPSFPPQSENSAPPANFRDFLSQSQTQSQQEPLPVVPEDQEAMESLRNLGDHLTLAPANSTDMTVSEKPRGTPLRRSDTTSLSLWSGREDSCDVKKTHSTTLGRRDTEEVASLLDSVNTKNESMKPEEDGRKRSLLVAEESHRDKKLIRKTSGSLDDKSFLRTPSGDLAAILNSENVVLCKARAKRGFATHPRSIAERVRRTKIAENMKKLQELIPDVDKQANTADMLEDAVEYMKFLMSKIVELSGGNEDVLKFNFNRLKPSSSAGLPSGGASSKSGSDSE